MRTAAGVANAVRVGQVLVLRLERLAGTAGTGRFLSVADAGTGSSMDDRGADVPC
jgi:hypothetical protein